MGFTSVPRSLGACLVLASAAPTLTPVPRGLGASLVLSSTPSHTTPTPRALGASVVCSSPVARTTPVPRALGAWLALASTSPRQTSVPRALGAGLALSSAIPHSTPVPRALGAALVCAAVACRQTPIPAALGAWLALASTPPSPCPVPKGMGASLVLSATPDSIRSVPRALGACLVMSSVSLSAASVPRALGACLALQSVAPSPCPLPRGLGALLVCSSTPVLCSSKPAAHGAALVLAGSTGGSHMPFVSDKPYGLGAGIVLASTPEVIQFDETDHMLDSAWRANDHTKRYDYLQLLKNELALATLFAAKHAAGTGVHAPLGLSSMCDLTDAEWSATFSGLPSSAYVTQAFATASGFRSLLISPRDVTNVNPLECLCVFASGGQILHGFRALSGGSVHAYVKSWLYSDSTAYGGAAIRRQPTLYDATVQGLGWVKDMYRQGFRGALDVLSVYSRWHNRMTGEQRISFNAGLISTFYTSSIVASSLYSCAHALLCAHPTRPTVYLHRASPASGQVVVRTGFDDTSVYAVIETISGSPGTVPVTSMSAQVTKAAPTTYSLDWTDRSAFGFSAGEPAAAQILGNLTTLVRTFDEEHSILTGSHEIPVSSIKGYRMAYSATISAPATVGDQLLVEIEANPNIGEHHVYLPRMVGAAGSGVCTASIAFTETTVYLLVKRITAGTSNSFDAEVYVIDDE